MNGKPHQYIFLNGPPGSGKDTAAGFITREYLIESRHMKMSRLLKDAARALFFVPQTLWDELEKVGSNEAKNKPRIDFFGKSWREVLIWLSEECMKPKFGNDVFGVLFARQMLARTATSITVISDCGFAAEVAAVAKTIGARNCHVFQLYRPGCDFRGDSRSHINSLDVPAGVTFYTINNQHEKDMFRRQVLIRVNKIVGGDRLYD